MEHEVNDVMVVLTKDNEKFVGKLIKADGEKITLKDPYNIIIVPDPKDPQKAGLGFSIPIPYTDEIDIYFKYTTYRYKIDDRRFLDSYKNIVQQGRTAQGKSTIWIPDAANTAELKKEILKNPR